MRVAAYESNTDNTPTCIDLDWPELVDMLTDFVRTPCGSACKGKDCRDKYGAAWSPVDIDGPRASKNVRAITCAVFDLDHLPAEKLPQVSAAVAGFSSVLASTHTRDCYRLVMSLSRPVLPAEWPRFLRAAIDRFGLKGLADEACKDLARLYFTPSVPEGRQPYSAVQKGADIDVDAMLSQDGPDEAHHDAPETFDLDSMRKALQGKRQRLASSTVPERLEDAQLLARILGREALAQPGARDKTINAAASKLVWWTQGASVDALVELVRPSIGAMDCEPEGVSHWIEEFRDCAERSIRRREERDAERAQKDEALLARLARIAGLAEVPKGDASEVEELVDPEEEPDWKALLIMTEKGPKSCGENVFRILTHARETRGCFRLNEVTKAIEVHGGAFGNVSTNKLPTAVMNWLQRVHHLTIGEREVWAQIALVAEQNKYDPIRDYLRAVVWDGTPRLTYWLERYCGARTIDASGRDITAHVQRVGRKWLIAAVARALQPGCQVDTVLILEGEQGLRKSSALRVLGGDYYSSTQLTLGDKDTRMQLVRNWIVELAELASFKRSEVDAQKAFITERVDEYRAPYDRTVEKHPRRCIFAGTINPDSNGYLADRTGNRRYLPVAVTSIDVDALQADRDQLWAEAVAAYDAGETWWLTAEEQAEADAQAEARETHDAMEDKIAAWFYALEPRRRPEVLRTHEVAERIGIGAERSHEPRVTTPIGTALRRLGFEVKRVRANGRQGNVYVPTEAMRTAPQGQGPNHLRLVAQARAAEKKSGQGENS